LDWKRPFCTWLFRWQWPRVALLCYLWLHHRMRLFLLAVILKSTKWHVLESYSTLLQLRYWWYYFNLLFRCCFKKAPNKSFQLIIKGSTGVISISVLESDFMSKILFKSLNSLKVILYLLLLNFRSVFKCKLESFFSLFIFTKPN
jgi:hypothetical protein